MTFLLFFFASTFNYNSSLITFLEVVISFSVLIYVFHYSKIALKIKVVVVEGRRIIATGDFIFHGKMCYSII